MQIRPVRHFRTHFSAGVVLNKDEKSKGTGGASHSSSSSSDSELSDSDSELDDGEYNFNYNTKIFVVESEKGNNKSVSLILDIVFRFWNLEDSTPRCIILNNFTVLCQASVLVSTIIGQKEFLLVQILFRNKKNWFQDQVDTTIFGNACS